MPDKIKDSIVTSVEGGKEGEQRAFNLYTNAEGKFSKLEIITNKEGRASKDIFVIKNGKLEWYLDGVNLSDKVSVNAGVMLDLAKGYLGDNGTSPREEQFLRNFEEALNPEKFNNKESSKETGKTEMVDPKSLLNRVNQLAEGLNISVASVAGFSDDKVRELNSAQKSV